MRKKKTHEEALNLLFKEIDELVELRVTKERGESVVLAKIIAAVRTQRIFRAICLHPPDNVEDMKALLRGVAFEADNAALASASNYAFDFVGSISDS